MAIFPLSPGIPKSKEKCKNFLHVKSETSVSMRLRAAFMNRRSGSTLVLLGKERDIGIHSEERTFKRFYARTNVPPLGVIFSVNTYIFI